MPASQPKRFEHNLVLAQPASTDTPDAARTTETRGEVISIESAGVERGRGVSKRKLREWVERNKVMVRVDWIAMAAAIALLPIGAIFLVHTIQALPKYVQKSSVRHGVSGPIAPTRSTQTTPKMQDPAKLPLAASIVHKPEPDRAVVVSAIRYTSDATGTVVTVDLNHVPQFQVHRLRSPERVYLDLQKTKVAPTFSRKEIQAHDRLLRAIRVGEHEHGTTRITLGTTEMCEYSVKREPNSSQLRIELRKAQTGQASGAAQN